MRKVLQISVRVLIDRPLIAASERGSGGRRDVTGNIRWFDKFSRKLREMRSKGCEER
jgi:hypothetical protein